MSHYPNPDREPRNENWDYRWGDLPKSTLDLKFLFDEHYNRKMEMYNSYLNELDEFRSIFADHPPSTITSIVGDLYIEFRVCYDEVPGWWY